MKKKFTEKILQRHFRRVKEFNLRHFQQLVWNRWAILFVKRIIGWQKKTQKTQKNEWKTEVTENLSHSLTNCTENIWINIVFEVAWEHTYNISYIFFLFNPHLHQNDCCMVEET